MKDVSSGASSFAQQFKPLAMKKQSAKQLLIDDNDYSTPQDHYFSYLNKGPNGPTQEKEILEKLHMS